MTASNACVSTSAFDVEGGLAAIPSRYSRMGQPKPQAATDAALVRFGRRPVPPQHRRIDPLGTANVLATSGGWRREADREMALQRVDVLAPDRPLTAKIAARDARHAPVDVLACARAHRSPRSTLN